MSFISSLYSSGRRNKSTIFFFGLLILALMTLAKYFLSTCSYFEWANRLMISTTLNNPTCVILIIVLSLVLFFTQEIIAKIFTFPSLYPILASIEKAVLKKDWVVTRIFKDFRELIRFFKKSDSIASIYKRSFDRTSSKPFLSDVNMSITEMMLPDDADLKRHPLTSSLKFTSTLLYKKFKLHISYKMNFFSELFLLAGSIGIVSSVFFFHSFSERSTKERLSIDLLFMFIVPLLYWGTFYFKWSKKVRTYTVIFQISLLIISGVYSISTRTDYSMLGILVLQFISLNFTTSFLSFCSLTFLSIALFGSR